ncbi:hypothetical protein GQX73_g5242 [Xylaria multiplex]|uniref:Autophagy-related protein 1 n=1 Tax=Xylaria multiplex TaxID=323545 RepID=A0A7C8MU12_9PEZI|nr:hypothetical protein GQX73_g5242 [Xylaria multiplex]
MGPPLTTKLPELVRDSKLETTFNGDNTVHFYYDRPGRHAEPQREEWKKERLIGSGGNGVVWLEKQLAASSGEGNQARYRAVKQITLAQPRSILEICKSELEALAKFSTRKYARCFVRSFGWYEDSRSLAIAMEYCPLGDLQQFLIDNPRPLESDTREIIGQVVQGLQFMHDEGFAHRDLKPGNILIKSHPPRDGWWVKICDMGLSKRIEGVGAVTTAVKGTPGFFAPEQLGLGGTDPKMVDPFKTDIWCLGEMTFRILCDEAAFPSHNDLREYYQGTTMFPRERLSKIGPQSRLEAHQAFNHDWLININHDPTAGQKDPSSHVTTTAVPGPPIIRITEAEGVEEESNIEYYIKPQAGDIFGPMQQLRDIENYFNNNLQPRSLYYLNDAVSNPEWRGAEFRWLRTITERDILFKADNLGSQGDEKFRSRRKALIDRANTMLDELESANRRFIKQEEEQEGVEWSEGSTKNLRRQSKQGPAREERGKERKSVALEEVRSRHIPMHETWESSDSSDDVVYEPRANRKKPRETSTPSDSSDVTDVVYEPSPPGADGKKLRGTLRSSDSTDEGHFIYRPHDKNWNRKRAMQNPHRASGASLSEAPRIPTPLPLQVNKPGETSADDEMPRLRGQPRRHYSEISRDTLPIRPKPRDGSDKFFHRGRRPAQSPPRFYKRDSTHGPSSSYDRLIPVRQFTRAERRYETYKDHGEFSAPPRSTVRDGVSEKSPRSELTDSSIFDWLAGVDPLPLDSY